MPKILRTARKNVRGLFSGIIRIVLSELDDALFLAGCSAIVYGVSMFSIPAAWICGGMVLVAVGVMVGKTKEA